MRGTDHDSDDAEMAGKQCYPAASSWFDAAFFVEVAGQGRLVFCQENFEGLRPLKIFLQLTSQLLATRQLMIDRLLVQWIVLRIDLSNQVANFG